VTGGATGASGRPLRVLQVNKYHYLKGGAERYYFELSRMLEERGHDVVPFSMQDPENQPTEYAEFFVSPSDFDRRVRFADRLGAAVRVVYSVEARRKIEALVDRVRPDVAHLHNIAHQLSPSILYGLKAKGVPVVQTLHDYKLVCPNYQMFVGGEVCERCRGGRYYRAVVHRCMHGSTAKSLNVCVEAYLHAALGTYRRLVDLFVAPSRSIMDRMIAHGVAPSRIVHVPHAIALEGYEPSYESGAHAAYVGRLADGKGVDVVLRAAARVRGVRFVIAGTGPLADELTARAANMGLDNVEFLGYVTGDALRAAFSGAFCVIMPSECLENSPITVFESFAFGKPVVGASIGGIPELIVEGETGLLFDPGDDAGLAESVEALAGDRRRAAEMGRAARARLERAHSPEVHCRRILGIYERVIR
jgi:glycosyltransferase involved in cell wall biosynthesis